MARNFDCLRSRLSALWHQDYFKGEECVFVCIKIYREHILASLVNCVGTYFKKRLGFESAELFDSDLLLEHSQGGDVGTHVNYYVLHVIFAGIDRILWLIYLYYPFSCY